MMNYVLLLLVGLALVLCIPVENSAKDLQIDTTNFHNVERTRHNIEKRFINPMFNLGSLGGNDLAKLRTKRSNENPWLWDDPSRPQADSANQH